MTNPPTPTAALRWAAAALQCVARSKYPTREQDTIKSGEESKTVRQILDEADAALAQPNPTGWRDIASAPKDGTEIIVFHPVAGVCAAFCPGDGFAWHCMDGMNTVVGKKSGQSIPVMTSFMQPPTHWQPLPTPLSAHPAEQQEGDAAGEKDAARVKLPEKMPKHESMGGEYPSNDSYQEGYAEGWNDCIDAAMQAMKEDGNG